MFRCVCRSLGFEKTHRFHCKLLGFCPWKNGEKGSPKTKTCLWNTTYIHNNFPFVHKRFSEISVGKIKQETSAIAEKSTRRHVASRSMHCLRDIRLRTVGWPWNGVGVTQGHRKCRHSIAWVRMVSYSTSIAWPYLAPIFSPTLVFGAPVRGEAVGVQQRSSVTKN